MSRQPNSAAQILASRANGSLSRGPKTPEGKSKSSRNSLRHGLRAASAVILPHEDPREIRAYRDMVLRELGCHGELEDEAGLRIAALRWQLVRLDAIEERRLHAEALHRLDDLPEKKFFDLVVGTISAVRAMTRAMESRLPETREELGLLLVPIAAVVTMLSAVEEGGQGVFGAGALGSAVEMLKTMSDEAVHILAYGEVIEGGRRAGDALRDLLPEVEAKVESAKRALALEMPLPADRDVALRARYRRDIEKRLDSEVRFLTLLQERRAQEAPGSFGSGYSDGQSPGRTLAHL